MPVRLLCTFVLLIHTLTFILEKRASSQKACQLRTLEVNVSDWPKATVFSCTHGLIRANTGHCAVMKVAVDWLLGTLGPTRQ